MVIQIQEIAKLRAPMSHILQTHLLIYVCCSARLAYILTTVQQACPAFVLVNAQPVTPIQQRGYV
jgi:hypothetical protein